MEKLLETSQKFSQTQIWNDSCSSEELEYAIKRGAVGATTNPVIVLNVLKNELSDWQSTIQSLIADNPSDTEDDIAWKLIEMMGKHASKQLLPIYKQHNGKKGRLSFQTNAKFYRNAEKTLAHAKQLARVVENAQIKAPTSAAGIKAFEEMTYAGISINATVSFTCPQAIAVAEAVERGLKRREEEGLDITKMNPVCTIMVGRLDDYLKGYVKEHNLSISQESLNYAGVATFKNAYKIYKKRGYRTKLLAAAYRSELHWSEFIGGDVVLTIPHKWQIKFNASSIDVSERINIPVKQSILDELIKLDEFKRAYDENGMTPAEFEHFGAFKITMHQFLSGYDELVSIIRSDMIK
ncbi:MAG: transaldolase family protein [Breznakia sp.]